MSLSLKLGFRTFARNSRFALVNLLGLAIAMAAAFMIGLFVLHETDYDRWIPGAESLYLATSRIDLAGQSPVLTAKAPSLLKEVVENSFPEVVASARLMSKSVSTRVEDTPRFEKIAFADPEFFDLFDLPASTGVPRQALEDRRSLVLTKRAAERLFGQAEAVGRTMLLTLGGQEHSYRIAAVLEDFPSNTHVSDQIFASLHAEDFPEEQFTFVNWGSPHVLLYFNLAPNSDLPVLDRRLDATVNDNLFRQHGNLVTKAGIVYDMSLIPVPDLHLAGGRLPDLGDKSPGDPGLLLILSIIALLILAMAAVNYVNLASAIAMRRTRELALKRMFGASRNRMVRSFLAESLAVAAIAGILAVGMVEAAFPRFSAFLGLELAGASLWSWRGLLLVTGLMLLTGLLAGLYPGLLMARSKPKDLFSDASISGKKWNVLVRAGFIVLQFAVSIGLIASTIVISGQARHMREADVNYDRDGLIVVRGLDLAQARQKQEVVANSFTSRPGIVSAARAHSAPGDESQSAEPVGRAEGGDSSLVSINREEIDFGYFRTLGVSLLAGRTLTAEIAGDDVTRRTGEVNILLNRSAVRALGFETPDAAIGHRLQLSSGGLRAAIVGVVPDLRFGSLQGGQSPVFYWRNSDDLRLAVVRYRGITPEKAMASLEAAWREVVPDVPFDAFHVEDRLAEHTAREETRGSLLGAFALLAVALAAVGIYGIAAFTAQRRAREMAVRRVFGASTGRLLRMILGRFLGLVGIGGLIGVPVAAFFLARWLGGFSERIAHGPGPYLLALAMAALVALGSVAIEAWRVARTAPADMLRQD